MVLSIMGLAFYGLTVDDDEADRQVTRAQFIGKSSSVKVYYDDDSTEVLHGREAYEFVFNGGLPRS